MVDRAESPWKREAYDFARAFSGALLFGVPLLWTMEMWWIGIYAEFWKLFIFLGLVILLNTYLARFSGFKQADTLGGALHEAIDATATGIVVSALILIILNRLSPGDSLDAALGKIIINAIPLSIGAAAARALLGQNNDGDGNGNGAKDSFADRQDADGPWRATLRDFGATIVGGIFLSFAIAPTAEIPLLAAGMGPWRLLALVALSLLATYTIVFATNFGGDGGPREQRGYFQGTLEETILAYLLALFVALLALYLFDRVEFGDPYFFVLTQVLVLGFPAAVGGAVGRLVV